jgi:glycosyltransferase involved in cell wall biosynthesis
MTSELPRVLVITSTFPRWNNDTEPSFVFDLCRYLHGRGLQVDVIAPHAPGAEKQELLDGINVYRYPYFIASLQTLAYSGGILANLKKTPLNFLLVPFLVFAHALALYSRLKKTHYLLIHAHWLIPQGCICAFINMLLGRKAPALICTSHGGDLYALNNFFFTRIKKWTIERCTHFCVVSSAMKKVAMNMGVNADKISVMPMGVDLANEFKPVPEIKRNDQKLIFVGRLVEKKGVSVLIEAMARVIKKVPDAELLIVGDGPLRTTLEQKVKELGLHGHVQFLGSVPHHQLPELFSSAGIAVVPSIIDSAGDQEGLGLVVVEAMGCGCAVIASSLDAIRDVMDTDTGIFVMPDNSVDLAEKICLLFANRDLCHRLAIRGREKVTSQYDWQVAGARYYELIKNCI